MIHSEDDLDRAAARYEVLTDALDPGAAAVEVTDDLHRFAVVSDAVRVDELRLRDAARTRGRS